MPDLGAKPLRSTVRFTFNTTASDGAPITLAGSPVVSVYRSDSDAQTTTGVTLAVDYDSVVGRHHVTVVTTDAFYRPGDYEAVLTAGTVDGQSIAGATIGTFSLRSEEVVGDQTAPIGPGFSLLSATELIAYQDASAASDSTAQYNMMTLFISRAEIESVGEVCPNGYCGLVISSTYHFDPAEGGGYRAYWLRGDAPVLSGGRPNVDLITHEAMIAAGDAPASWTAGYPTTNRIWSDLRDSGSQNHSISFSRGADGNGYLSYGVSGVDGVVGDHATYVARMNGSPVTWEFVEGTKVTAAGEGDYVHGMPGGFANRNYTWGEQKHAGYAQRSVDNLPGVPGAVQGTSLWGGTSDSGLVLYEATDATAWNRIAFAPNGHAPEEHGLPDTYRNLGLPVLSSSVVSGPVIVSIDRMNGTQSGGSATVGDLYQTLWSADGRFDRLTLPKLLVRRGTVPGNDDAHFGQSQLIRVFQDGKTYFVLYQTVYNGDNEPSVVAYVFDLRDGVSYEPLVDRQLKTSVEYDFRNRQALQESLLLSHSTGSGSVVATDDGYRLNFGSNTQLSLLIDEPIDLTGLSVIEIEFGGLHVLNPTNANQTLPNLLVGLVDERSGANALALTPAECDQVLVRYSASNYLARYRVAGGANVDTTDTEILPWGRSGALENVGEIDRTLGMRIDLDRQRLVYLVDGNAFLAIPFAPTIDRNRRYRPLFRIDGSVSANYILGTMRVKGYSKTRLRRELLTQSGYDKLDELRSATLAISEGVATTLKTADYTAPLTAQETANVFSEVSPSGRAETIAETLDRIDQDSEAAKVASEALDTRLNPTVVGRLDASISSRSSHAAPDLSGLSTFDPASDGVTLAADQSGVTQLGGVDYTGSTVPGSGGGGGTVNVLQHDIDNDFVFNLPSRKSGISLAKRPIILSNAAERPRFAFDVSPIADPKPIAVTAVAVLDAGGNVSAGLVVATQTDATNCGVRDYLVMSKVTGATTAGTYTVRVTFTLQDTSTLVAEGQIIVP